MAPLSVETGTLLLVIFAAVALPGIPAVLFLVIRHCWMAYGDISPVVVERMEAVGEQLPYWLKLRRHPQFPVSLHEQIELLVQATERVDYTLREIRTGDRQRGWFPLRKAWDGRETYVEAAKALVQLVDKEASDVRRRVSGWHREHPIIPGPNGEDKDKDKEKKTVDDKRRAAEETGGNVVDASKGEAAERGREDPGTQPKVGTASNDIV